MTDFTDPSGASIRLSNTEREQAVAALQNHAHDGRLSEAELATRSATARAAVTRGDLAPLFADLPGALPGSSATGTFSPPNATTSSEPPHAAATDSPGRENPAGETTAPRYTGRRRNAIMGVIPFVSLILFFLTSAIWGFAYSWLWFLLIPIAGVILYSGGGSDGGRDRDRNRDRR